MPSVYTHIAHLDASSPVFEFASGKFGEAKDYLNDKAAYGLIGEVFFIRGSLELQDSGDTRRYNRFVRIGAPRDVLESIIAAGLRDLGNIEFRVVQEETPPQSSALCQLSILVYPADFYFL